MHLVPRACLLAVVALTALPSTAFGWDLYFDTADGSGSVRAQGYYECSGGPCPPSPISLTLTRGGGVVASGGPSTSVTLAVRPEAGDVARVYRDGVEKAAVTFEGRPTVDDTSCGIVGRSSVSGTFRRGDPNSTTYFGGQGVLDPHTVLRVGLSGAGGASEGSLSASGDRYSATFGRSIAANDSVTVTNDYHVNTAVGPATVQSRLATTICRAETKPPPCTIAEVKEQKKQLAALLKIWARELAKAWRTGARLSVGTLTCGKGKVTGRLTTRRGRRKVLLASGRKALSGENFLASATVNLKLTRQGRRLRRTQRRMRTRVTLRVVDRNGGYHQYSRRVALRRQARR